MSKQSRSDQVASYSSSGVTYADGEDAALQVDANGGLKMGASSPASLSTAYRAPTAGGWSTLATLIASGGSQLTGASLLNLNATPAYLDIFDTTGAVTLGTTVPTATIPLAANATSANGSGLAVNNVNMKLTSGGLKIAAVTAPGGSTLVTNGLVGTIWAR
jgi:hypothetical protein